MRTAQAVVAAAMEMAAPVMTMAAAVPSSVASATSAERHAREQGRQNKNGNSNGWFGHGTLRAPLARRLRHHMTPMGTESSIARLPGANPLVELRVKAR
jgi:hypothetical protein